MRLLRAVFSTACIAAVVHVAAHGESPVRLPPGIAAASPDDEAAAVEVARRLTKEVLARYGRCRREMGEAWKTLGRDFRGRHAAELRVFDNLPEAERAKLRNELRANVEATWRAITSRSQFSEREVRGLDRLMGEVGEAATALDRPTSRPSSDEGSRKLAALHARYGVAAVELARGQAAVNRGAASYDFLESIGYLLPAAAPRQHVGKISGHQPARARRDERRHRSPVRLWRLVLDEPAAAGAVAGGGLVRVARRRVGGRLRRPCAALGRSCFHARSDADHRHATADRWNGTTRRVGDRRCRCARTRRRRCPALGRSRLRARRSARSTPVRVRARTDGQRGSPRYRRRSDGGPALGWARMGDANAPAAEHGARRRADRLRVRDRLGERTGRHLVARQRRARALERQAMERRASPHHRWRSRRFGRQWPARRLGPRPARRLGAGVRPRARKPHPALRRQSLERRGSRTGGARSFSGGAAPGTCSPSARRRCFASTVAPGDRRCPDPASRSAASGGAGPTICGPSASPRSRIGTVTPGGGYPRRCSRKRWPTCGATAPVTSGRSAAAVSCAGTDASGASSCRRLRRS